MQMAAKSLLFAILATPTLCLVLQSGTSRVPSANLVCDLSSQLAQDFVLIDDETLLSSNSTEVKDDEPVGSEAAQKKATLKEALGKYKKTRTEFLKAQGNLMQSMEKLLQVPAADSKEVELLGSGEAGKDTLMVFYAPWCPHCQQFVLHDGKGDPMKAPLEVFNRELQKAKEPVSVVRVNTQKVQKFPKVFEIEFIPTAYFVNRAGQAYKFKGNAHDTKALTKFMDEHRAIEPPM